MRLLFCVCLTLCVFASEAQLSQGGSCDTDADCCKQECCDFSDFIATKRQAGDDARFPISSLRGTCRPLAQEGESCSGFGCGCAPGLQCVQEFPLIATRDVAALPPDGSGGSFAPFPYSVCRRRPEGRVCYSNEDCNKGQCCSFSSGGLPGDLLSKRIVLAHPTSGICQDYNQEGQSCFGPCGCAPGLTCIYDNLAREVSSDASLIMALPGTCERSLV